MFRRGVRRAWRSGVAVLLVALFALSFAQASELQPGDGQPLPPVRWYDADGVRHQLSDHQARPKVLHFWAAWCVPCRQEMPEMVAWKKQNPDIEVLPLSLDDRMAQARYFIRKNNLDMPALLLDEEDGEALAIPVLPYTLFVSADGRLLGHYPGMAPWRHDGFGAEVRALLGLAATP